MDAGQFFQQIDFALNIETPGGNLYAEAAAGCARYAETEAAQDALYLIFVKIDAENAAHL